MLRASRSTYIVPSTPTGQTVDFLLSARRDAVGAKRFFGKAVQSTANRSPRAINVDKSLQPPLSLLALDQGGGVC